MTEHALVFGIPEPTPSENADNVCPVDVVLYGFQIVIPLITQELLKVCLTTVTEMCVKMGFFGFTVSRKLQSKIILKLENLNLYDQKRW